MVLVYREERLLAPTVLRAAGRAETRVAGEGLSPPSNSGVGLVRGLAGKAMVDLERCWSRLERVDATFRHRLGIHLRKFSELTSQLASARAKLCEPGDNTNRKWVSGPLWPGSLPAGR